jgi:signal transduction histidine kinase
MAIKQLIGEILSNLGFVTIEQLEEALGKQKEIIRRKTLPEHLQRTRIVAESRSPVGDTSIPFLGELLIEMGYVTRSQMDSALKKQGDMFEKYCSLESDSLCTVLDIGTLINSSLNLGEVLSRIMQNANRITNSAASTLMLLEDNSGDLVFSVPTGPNADELVDIRIEKERGIAGWVAKHEQLLIVSDVKNDHRFYAKIDAQTGFETKSILAVPLKAKHRLIGVLEVINKENDELFTEQDALLLTIFASHAAMAIENARLHEELRDQMEKEHRMKLNLADSEKYRALGQLSSGVAHDFNNILSAIIGFSEMVLYNRNNENEVKSNIEQVLKAGNRAEDLVQQILAFSRQNREEKIPIQCSQIADECLILLRATIPSTTHIHQDISPNAGNIIADPTKIHQVLINLCTNAQHAIGDGDGLINIKMLPLELDAEDVSSYPGLEPGSYVKICVSDNGCGMDQHTLNQVFEPYFTTKEKGVGTGLGLAVVHGIVKSHNGHISVESEPDKGTVFEILLPRIDGEIDKEEESGEPLPVGTENILFVDDEEILIELGSRMLSYLGYHVTTCKRPVEALEIFKTGPDWFDLVISDMTMPGITGDQLAIEMMKIRRDIPIILCTGFSDRVTEKRAKELGIKAFIMKPILMRDLAKLIREVL